MAGGPLAEYVTCAACLENEGTRAKATRFDEGIERDGYRCEQGHESWIDWSREPATDPQWPPPADIGANVIDPVERAEYEREIERFRRTSNVKPSKLVR